MNEPMREAAADRAAVFADIVNDRKSARGFKPDPVPRDLLDRVFSVALRAPSNCNTQPWQTHVASGEPLEKLRAICPEAFVKGEFTMDFPYDGKYQGVYKERQYASAEALYSAISSRSSSSRLERVLFAFSITCSRNA